MPIMPPSETDPTEDMQPPAFLQIGVRGLSFAARSKKLKEGDVLVAFDGEMFNGDAEMLSMRQGVKKSGDDDQDEAEREPMTPHLLTFWRQGQFFHVIFSSALTAGFEPCSPDLAEQINIGFTRLKFAPLETYRNFEFFRDVRKNVSLHLCEPEALPKYAPFLWMMNHRLYYPMIAVGIVHVLTFLMHWSLFALTYLLLSIYTYRGQISLLRSYKLFEDKFFWMVLAEPSEIAARTTCKALAPDVKISSERITAPKAAPYNPYRVQATGRKTASLHRKNQI